MTKPRESWRRSLIVRWAVRVGLLALAILVLVSVARAYRALDLDSIGAAFAELVWWESLVLAGLLAVRQVLNAGPLSVYIPGVSLWRATVNDLSASTASAFAPPPSDVWLRVALFRRWGYPLDVVLAGTTMNAMNLFIVRFGTPLAGFVLFPLTGQALGLRLVDVASLLVCAALVAGVLFAVRGDAQARALGRALGGLVRRARPATEPSAWADAFHGFQQQIARGFASRFPRALALTAGMVAADLMLLALALRFVGVDATVAPLLVIATAFLFAYPLTLFPMQGMGIVDAAILASLVSYSGADAVEAALAALIIWRVFTVAGPLAIGLVLLGLGRRM